MATYSISPNSSTINEGGSVTWTIITTGVANGTQLFWENIGTSTASDFTSGSNTGSIVINNNFAVLPLAVREDFTSEGGVETIILRLRETSLSGPIVALASAVNIADTSTEKTYTIVSSSTTVGEGNAITWTITTTNVATGTALYWINIGNTGATDFVESTKSGVIYVNSSGIATLTLNLIGDLALEGAENIIIQIKTDSVAGPTVAAAPAVIVIDSSIGTNGNFIQEPETIIVNDKLVLSSNKRKNNIFIIERINFISEKLRLSEPKTEGTFTIPIVSNGKLTNTIPNYRLQVNSSKIYDIDNLINPRFSPNVINISSKYIINSIKNYTIGDLKTFTDSNNGVSLLKIDTAVDGTLDIRDYYNNNRRWTVLLNSTTSVPWGSLKVEVDSVTGFRYLDLSGGTFEVAKINNKDTQIYQQPTAIQARTIPGGVSPAVEIKKNNTRFYLWKPRTQSLSAVLLNKSLFIATDSDEGTRGGSNVTYNKGVLTGSNVVHLDRVNNNNFFEISQGSPTVWTTASTTYTTTGAPSKLNGITHTETLVNSSTVGFLSEWQTLIVTSESEDNSIEGTCWTQNILAIPSTNTTPAQPARYLLNGVGTQFLRDLKVGDSIINKDFVGYGFQGRKLVTGAPDNGGATAPATQINTVKAIINNTLAEVTTQWTAPNSIGYIIPFAPYTIFKNLTKQSRGLTKYYVDGVLVATSTKTYQSWLIDKIGAMNSTAKTTTTAHAAPGFLAQAGILDKTLSDIEAYELHVRLKYLKDSTVDQSVYLIEPHYSQEKYEASSASSPAFTEIRQIVFIEGSAGDSALANWNRGDTFSFTNISGLGPVVAHGSGAGTYTLTLNYLPPHDKIRYKVYWHGVDSLDLEPSSIIINGQIYAQFNVKTEPPTEVTFTTNLFESYSVIPATYSYAPFYNNTNNNIYIAFDSGFISHTSSNFVVDHILGHNQAQTDEAQYISHVEVEILTLVPTGVSSLGFINPPDLLSRQLIVTNRNLITSEKLKTNIGPGVIENQSEIIVANSKSGLNAKQLINVKSEKVIPFESTTIENWAY